MVTPAAVAAGAALAAGAILRATQEEALLSGPEYIRDAQPAGLTRRIGLGLARAACQRYANNPGAVNADRATSFENACRPYLDDIGGGTGAALGKPFEGGQCATGYLFNISAAAGPQPGSAVNANAWVTGPILGWRSSKGADSTTLFVTANSGPRTSAGCNSPPVGGIQERVWAVVSNAERGGFSARIENQCPAATPSCGNPPPVITDPTPPPTPFPIPVPIVIAPDVNIDVNVEINPDGTINFDIGTGDITIDPFGEGDDGGGEGGDPDTSPPAPEPGPTNPGGNGGFGGDDQFGPPPAGRRWVGCCLTITNRPDNSGIITGSEPEDVYPTVIGNVRLVLSASGSRQTDTPVRINAKKVCVWEPVSKLNPTGINVDLLPGFGYTFTPYSVPSGD